MSYDGFVYHCLQETTEGPLALTGVVLRFLEYPHLGIELKVSMPSHYAPTRSITQSAPVCPMSPNGVQNNSAGRPFVVDRLGSSCDIQLLECT